MHQWERVASPSDAYTLNRLRKANCSLSYPPGGFDMLNRFGNRSSVVRRAQAARAG